MIDNNYHLTTQRPRSYNLEVLPRSQFKTEQEIGATIEESIVVVQTVSHCFSEGSVPQLELLKILPNHAMSIEKFPQYRLSWHLILISSFHGNIIILPNTSKATPIGLLVFH